MLKYKSSKNYEEPHYDIFRSFLLLPQGKRKAMRHYATSRKVAGLISDGDEIILPAALRHWGRLSL
jgi:hypothetical protein